MRVVGPGYRLGILTGAAVVALVASTLLGGSGPHPLPLPAPITPLGIEVGDEEAACPGGERQVVLRGFGRPITVRLKGAPRRSLVRRQPNVGGPVRDQWELVWRQPCPAIPCPPLESGFASYLRRGCADR